MLHTTTPASHTPSDFRDPGNSWYGDEMDENEVDEILDAAATRIQAVRRGTAARKQQKKGDFMEPSQGFSVELVKSRLTGLAPTADGLGFACTKLDASGLRISGGLSAVSSLKHLSTVDLSDNRLSTLSGLEGLPQLAVLVCRGNRLQGVLDFPAPRTGSCLRSADLRSNSISGAISLPPPTPPPENGGASSTKRMGVEAHTRLEELLLDENQLRSLRGLSAIPYLRTLTASANQLIDTAGTEQLTSLTTLDLSANQLENCVELSSLIKLRTLKLNGNQITTMPSLSKLSHLESIDLTDNGLPSLEDLAKAIGGGSSEKLHISPIRTLTILGNPLIDETNRPDWRYELIHLLPNLAALNHEEVTPEDKVNSHNMAGDDETKLRAIRREYFSDAPNTNEAHILPGLMHMYRMQYTKAFQEGTPLPPVPPVTSRPWG